MSDSEAASPSAGRVSRSFMSGEFIFRSFSTGAVLLIMSLLLAGDTHFSTAKDVNTGIYIFALIFRAIGALLIVAALVGVIRQLIGLTRRIGRAAEVRRGR